MTSQRRSPWLRIATEIRAFELSWPLGHPDSLVHSGPHASDDTFLGSVPSRLSPSVFCPLLLTPACKLSCIVCRHDHFSKITVRFYRPYKELSSSRFSPHTLVNLVAVAITVITTPTGQQVATFQCQIVKHLVTIELLGSPRLIFSGSHWRQPRSSSFDPSLLSLFFSVGGTHGRPSSLRSHRQRRVLKRSLLKLSAGFLCPRTQASKCRPLQLGPSLTLVSAWATSRTHQCVACRTRCDHRCTRGHTAFIVTVTAIIVSAEARPSPGPLLTISQASLSNSLSEKVGHGIIETHLSLDCQSQNHGRMTTDLCLFHYPRRYPCKQVRSFCFRPRFVSFTTEVDHALCKSW